MLSKTSMLMCQRPVNDLLKINILIKYQLVNLITVQRVILFVAHV
jgi:hypothetical protein